MELNEFEWMKKICNHIAGLNGALAIQIKSQNYKITTNIINIYIQFKYYGKVNEYNLEYH